MSRHHAAHAGDVTHILRDIESMSKEDAERFYGIEFRENGKVFDDTYNKEFTSIGEWAEFNVEQDEIEFAEDIGREHENHWS